MSGLSVLVPTDRQAVIDGRGSKYIISEPRAGLMTPVPGPQGPKGDPGDVSSAMLAASTGAGLIGTSFGDTVEQEIAKLRSDVVRYGAYVPIPPYPNGTIGALATRIDGGDGRFGNITIGSLSSFTTSTNPARLQQLFSDAVVTSPVNWAANEAIKTVVGPGSNAMFAGLFSEISTYAVNNREVAGLVGFAKALADRDPSGTGSGGDLWGVWAIAANNGHLAHAIGVEVNVMNQHAHWFDHGDPTGNDPTHYTFGVHVYPDWSTKTNTRAVSIRPRSDGAGWATGILTTGYTDVGIFVDSLQTYRDPGDNLLPADPIGLVFGPHTQRKLGVQRMVGGSPEIHWEMSREGQFLLWRRNASYWWLAMAADDNSLRLVNGNAVFDANGSFSFSGSLSISSYSVVTATNGGALTLAAAQPAITLDPAAPIASFTVTLPPSPQNGQEVSLGCTQNITAFTLNGGAVANAPTTFPGGSTMRFKFSTAKNAWYRN